MQNKKLNEIHEVLVNLSHYPHVLSLRVLSNDGTIRFSTDESEVNKKVDISKSSVISYLMGEEFQHEPHSREDQMLTTSTRIENSIGCHSCHDPSEKYRGVIEIRSDISEIHTVINKMSFMVIASAIVLLIFMASTITLLHLRLVQGSIKTLNEGIEQIESGDFTHHIDVQPSQELGHLAISFNRMNDKLNTMQKELNTAHNTEIARAEKLASLGEISAGMAHEIKNPVSGILSSIKVMRKSTSVEPKWIQIFDEIERQLKRVDRAVNSLLAYAKPTVLEIELRKVNSLISNIPDPLCSGPLVDEYI